MSLLEAVLAFALVLVVPLATGPEGLTPRGQLLLAAAGALGASSFWLGGGPLAAGAASVWVVATFGLFLRRLGGGEHRRRDLVELIPFAYLTVGAGWLVASRYGAHPLGFGATIVLLTAVHFHFAGFVASVLVLRLPGDAPPIATARMAVLAATPVTAAGITVHPALGALGAALFVFALSVYSWAVITRVAPSAPRPARFPLYVSAGSVVAGIALGFLYALGQWIATPAPTIDVMARTHGVLNAFGFSLCGVVGWTVIGGDR